MRPNFEVMQITLELAETVLSGLYYIKAAFSEGRFEEMLPILLDVTEALRSIEQATHNFMETEKMNSLPIQEDETTDRLHSGLRRLVEAYEYTNWLMASNTLEIEVIPEFEAWREELETCFRFQVMI